MTKNAEANAWFNFDDAFVSSARPEENLSGSSYILFYERRGDPDADAHAPG